MRTDIRFVCPKCMCPITWINDVSRCLRCNHGNMDCDNRNLGVDRPNGDDYHDPTPEGSGSGGNLHSPEVQSYAPRRGSVLPSRRKESELMGYGNPDIEEIRTLDLEIELQRRKIALENGLCPYCGRPIEPLDKHGCKINLEETYGYVPKDQKPH
jgi:hypothetical protein